MSDLEVVQRELRVHETLDELRIQEPAFHLFSYLKIASSLSMFLFGIALAVMGLFYGNLPFLLPAALASGVASLFLRAELHELRTERQPVVRLRSANIELGDHTVPIEDVQDITFVSKPWYASFVEFRLREETVRRPCGVERETGTALVRILRHHVERRREALIAQGEDLGQEAAPPPGLLQKMADHQRRS